MAVCPFANHELIAPGVNDPKIEAVGLTLHVAVSKSDDIHDYFATQSGGLESHFYITFDGTIRQYRDTAYEADAQARGNSWIRPDGTRVGMISVETAGLGDGKWTTDQLAAIKRLINWCDSAHKKFKTVPATEWNSGGIGYHSQFIEWNPNAHSCPGPQRVPQVKEIIWPWLSSLKVSQEKRESLRILLPAISHATGRRKDTLLQIQNLWNSIK